MGLEVAVGFMIAWVVAKARRAGKQLDGVADAAVDTGAARVRELVLAKLSGHAAVQRVEREATENGEVSEEARLRLKFALEDAAEADASFAARLQAALTEAAKSGGPVATHGATAVSGTATASGAGSSAVGTIGSIDGDVSFGGHTPDPRRPGQA